MPTALDHLNDRITKLEETLLNPLVADKRPIEHQLAILQQAKGASSTTSSSGGTPADVATGINQSTSIAGLAQSLQDLRAELVNSKELSELLFQDSGTPRRFFVRTTQVDQTTGQVTSAITNLDGTTPSPSPTAPLQPVKGNELSIQQIKYVATAAGTGYTVGSSIVNMLIFDQAGALVGSTWYNITTAVVLSSIPAIGNLKGYEDRTEELLTAQNTLLQSILNNVITPNIRSLDSGSDSISVVLPASVDQQTALLQAIDANTFAPEIRALTTADQITATVASLPGALTQDLNDIRRYLSPTKDFYVAALRRTIQTNSTDILGLRGSASKKISITRISINLRGTSATRQTVTLLRRSAPNTGGTSSNPVAAKLDTLSPNASATIIDHTVKPTGLGTLAGTIHVTDQIVPVTTSLVDESGETRTFGIMGYSQPIVLRGVNEFFWINLDGVSPNNLVASIVMEWFEE